MADSDEKKILEFIEAMRSAGVYLDTATARGSSHPIADGKIHRANAQGKAKAKNQHIWYVLHLDSPASGAFGDLQTGVQDTWTEKRPSTMTPAERAALKQRMVDTQRQRDEERAALHAAATAAATAIMASTEKAPATHAYLARKRLPPFPGLRHLKTNVRYVIDPEEDARTARAGSLVVPIYTPAGALVSVQLIDPAGTKRFLKGTAKEGNYHSIGKRPEEPGAVIAIAEGYSTAARVHEATGYLTIAAFDAGNLASVSKAIREKYPEARLLFAADNDRLVKMPDGRMNPGLTKARDAADAVGGVVAYPEFPDADIELTDFDDLAQKYGLDRVTAVIDAVINPPVGPDESNPPPADDTGGYDPDFGAEHEEAVATTRGADGDAEHPLASFGDHHFRCLGVDETTLFFQPANVAQVIALNAAQLSAANMMRLAPLQWWETEFPGTKEGVDWKAAINACMQACMYRRKFVPHNSVRGRGAWFEGETAIYHAGDHLIVDSQEKSFHEHRSRFVYDEGETMAVDMESPASTAEARGFLKLSKSLRWVSPLSGYLLAGWCVVAPVCGFLKWRPHIWVNGPAGSGKSTVMDKIVKRCLAATALSVVGNTTEAGVRGALGMDALPIIFDEVEPKDQNNQNRIRAIMDLARVAASEGDGLILKGTANQKTKGFRARSMFVFASIVTQIEGYADESRITQLTLADPAQDTEEEKAENKKHYEQLLSDIVGLLTPAFSKRLLARTIMHLPTLRSYVDVFTVAAAQHLGSQRLGDQLGPMLAGAYLLNTTKPVTVATALEWLRANDWTDHSAKGATKDSDRFLQHITGYLVRHNTPEGGTWERTIGELLELAAYAADTLPANDGYGTQEPNKKKGSAIAALGRMGIRVWRGEAGFVVDITTSHESFKRLVLRNTEWASTKYRDILKGIPGAYSGKGNRYFSSGINTPFVTVPLNALLRERVPGEDDG
ncbi:MAG: toprim domain-containing protein [Mesorhizobium sp.]|uniref:toprim domain-containing protein n=1 Tax=Mesorhizobium sp. TaxID=1871066 RepID=UPI000FE896B3|nr:toprim domain-containing protein [Mesorhizobium sp.]RWC28130.1 MAG: toprim domain-containing protein [Mesorhizobium sp.]